MKDFSKRWSQQLLQALGFALLLPYLAYGQDVCHPSPCGSNTQCIGREGRPVCVCLPGYRGNPLVHCQRGECAETSDCPGNRVCRDYTCVDVCAGQCGSGAQCTPRNHIPVCTCPPGYTGDPLVSCRPFNPHRFFATWIDDRLSHPRSVLVGLPREELCQPSPCGANTQCDVVGGVPTCSCLPGYIGQPLSGCRHECETDYDCPANARCSSYKCEQVCTPGACSNNARCEPINHRAVCKCASGTFGDPYGSGCHLECESHYDCPSSRPACSAGKCIDPCAAGVCGVGADCRVKERTTPVCSCPRDMTGDPFVRCRPFEKRDLCVPNPCGANAECTPGHDQTGKERPVCTCPPGYLGNALVACHRGECQSDADCRYDQACSGYSCRPACQDQCGVGAECHARNHVATCTCPPGTTGQPLARCNPIPAPVAAVRRNGRLYYTKKK